MLVNKLFVFVSLLIVICCRSQTNKLSTTEMNSQYDEIEAKDFKFKEIDQIKRLYAFYNSKNYKPGILRGLVAFQRHFLTKGDYDASLDYGNKAEIMAKHLNNAKMLSIIYMQKGNIYIRLGMSRQGKKNLDLASKYCEKIVDKSDRGIIFSYIYATDAGLYEGRKKYDSVIYYHKKALQIIENIPVGNLNQVQKTKYYYLLIINTMNMGNSYTYFFPPPQLEKAEPYFEKTLSYSKSAPQYFEPMAMDAYYSVAYFYYKKKDYSKSIEFSEKLLEIEKKEKDPEQRLSTYEILKDSYGALNDFPQQNKYLRLYSSLSDSLSQIQNNTIVLYSERKKNDSMGRISDLKKYLSLCIVISGLIIVITGMGLYGRNRMLKEKYLALIDKLDRNYETNSKPVVVNVEERENPKINISSDKERDLLKKIEAFETSQKFLRKNLTLSYMSDLFNTNPRYLSQIIHNHKGQNFNNYINRLRINYISDRLYNVIIYREYKVSYLAEECGYASPQVFINAFRKETGMTPSYFIKELKKQAIVL